jgi:hypothetical protein
VAGNFVSTGKGCCCTSLGLAGGRRSIKVGGQQPKVYFLSKSGRRAGAACFGSFVNVRACVRACVQERSESREVPRDTVGP